MKQCRAEFLYGIGCPSSGFIVFVAMAMFAQHPVRQCAVSQQLDRAVEVPFQPFGVDACGRVIVSVSFTQAMFFTCCSTVPMSWLTRMMAQSRLISASNW